MGNHWEVQAHLDGLNDEGKRSHCTNSGMWQATKPFFLFAHIQPIHITKLEN